MLVKHQFRVAAPATRAWKSLTLNAAAGGCSCDQWAGGSAEHGCVIMGIPGGDPAHKLDALAPIVNEVPGLQFGAFAEDAGRR
jgi:hypothetical protein